MKILLLCGLSLVLVMALVAVIGACLPRDHVATRAVIIKQAPSLVFAAIRDVNSYPAWRKGITSVEVLPANEGRFSFRETSRHGAIPYVIEAEQPPTSLVTRIVDAGLPFGGAWTFTLTPADGGGTEVRITERGFVKNVVFRFLARFVFGYSTTIDGYLRDLALKCGAPAAALRD
jgi:uncharacterized protein YndB with AHSA1/START domain